MSKGNAVRNTRAGKEPPAAPEPVVKEALEVTWTLKGHLKNAQVAYIRVGILLARVRDEKLYAALDHADMESYAEERLHLGRASLYRYLQAHDWISEFHKEWLQPKPKAICVPSFYTSQDLSRTFLGALHNSITPSGKFSASSSSTSSSRLYRNRKGALSFSGFAHSATRYCPALLQSPQLKEMIFIQGSRDLFAAEPI